MATKNLIDVVNNFSGTLASGITASDTSIVLNEDISTLPSAQGILVIDRVNSAGTATPTLREYIRYSSKTDLTKTITLDSAVVGRGFESSTAQAHSAGAIVEGVWSASHHNYLIDAFDAEHDDDGKHTVDTISEKSAGSGVTVDGVLLKDSEVTTDTIKEKTGDAGVTVDSLLIKDGNITITDKAPIMNVKARAYLSTDQLNINDGNWVKITLDSESYDIGSDFNTTSNAFVAPVTGYYLIIGVITFSSVIADKIYRSAIYKASSAIQTAYVHSSHADGVSPTVCGVFKLTAADSITLYTRVDVGASTVDVVSGATETSLTVHLLSTD